MSSDPSLDWRAFDIEQSGTAVGHCECCGTDTERVWGLVRRAGEPVSAFFIAWTRAKPDHGAAFDLILGKWGEGATKDDRYAVALDFRLIEGVPKFMVVDAVERATSGSPLVGTSMMRSDLIGTPLADQVFALIDAIYLSQSASEVRSWSEG